VSAAQTQARGGSGRAAEEVDGGLESFVPHEPAAEPVTTGELRTGFDAATSQRMSAEASERSDMYANPDGSFTRQVHATDVNYQKPDGSWQPIDLDLVRAQDGRLQVSDHELRVSLAGTVEAPAGPGRVAGDVPGDATASEPAMGTDANGPVTELVALQAPTGETVGYTLLGAQPSKAVVDGRIAYYRGILPQTDLELATQTYGVKETLILRSPQAPSQWVFPLRLDGLTPRLLAGRAVELVNAAGEVTFELPPGYMEDSNVDPHSGSPASSNAVSYELITLDDGSPALRVTADEAWLNDPARVYPVRVDPTVGGYETDGDVFVENRSEGDPLNGPELKVGTYNGGSYKARSFIRFGRFDEDFENLRITSINLKVFHTWSYDCITHNSFNVRKITESVQWFGEGGMSYGDVPWPGPATSQLTSFTITDNYPACTNTSGNRSTGKWWTISLPVDTFNDWTTGGANYGLALTASESTSTAWKQFTSENHSGLCGGYSCDPRLDVTYATNVAPTITERYPGNNAVVRTLRPELVVRSKDSDSFPDQGIKHRFVVFDDAGTEVANSGLISATSWRLPANSLKWNKTYVYTVQAYDNISYSALSASSTFAFTTAVPQPAAFGSGQSSGKGYDAASGNFSTSAVDASVATVGPPLAVTRVFNSMGYLRDGAFGRNWASPVDARAIEMRDFDGDVQAVAVTYPTGQQATFGRNGDGSFTAPPGRYATLTATTSGGSVTGYTLTDKNATVYRFAQPAGSDVFKITSVTDANGRALTFGYEAGLATTMTSASGRRLHFTWQANDAGSTWWYPHVVAVRTDPVVPDNPGSALTWNYQYAGYDQLTGVCAPTTPSECTTYEYASMPQHRNEVLARAPLSYWPLSETSGQVAHSAVLSRAGTDNARYYGGITLGAEPGPVSASTATAARFNGSSGFVKLPGKMIVGGQQQTISMWFKTTATNGVLFSYSKTGITSGSTSDYYVPALYVGSDGKLRGEFWVTGESDNPITSSTAVNDGAWHHVALVVEGDAQKLYLDHSLQGSKTGPISLASTSWGNTYVGVGYVGEAWPGHALTGASPALPSYFNGSISDVAYYAAALTSADVYRLHRSGTGSNLVLKEVARPSGGVATQVSYDRQTGRVASVTDEHGGTWSLGQPRVHGSDLVYEGAVVGSSPLDYWRLTDEPTSPAPAEAANTVLGNTASFNAVTLGVDGPFDGATGAGFNGTSSYIQLSEANVPTTGPMSVEMWFKMPSGSTKGGVLYSYQNQPMSNVGAASSWVPALYVGTDGKLRGGLWTGSSTQRITASGTVNDGQWHHVALSAGAGNQQSMYLDGVLAGTMSHTIVATSAVNAYVGAGKWSGWPAYGSTTAGYWPGSLAEVAYYDTALSAEQVQAHVEAAEQTAPVAVAMVSGAAQAIPMPVSTIDVTGPSGETISHSYDLVHGGRMVAQTDALGNTTKYGYDAGGFANVTLDPRGVMTRNVQDVRGNTIQAITCQDQAAQLCSSVYYEYYPNATAQQLAPDARNDVLLRMRDGRSASPTDNTFLTSYAYDTKGNQTTVTDPLGRVTTTSYTDGTTVAAEGGGFAPAGLPRLLVTPGGARQQVVYYATGDMARVTDPAGKVTFYTYDGLGRQLTETVYTERFPLGLTSSYTYDGRGRVITQTDPGVLNRVTGATHTARVTLGYDIDGNVRSETYTDLTGGDAPRTVSSTYNTRGQKETATDAVGNLTRYGYDDYGRVTTETGPDDEVTENSYDLAGNLLTVTVLGFTGRPNDPSPQDLVQLSKAYDPAGRLASETDAMGWTTEYTYTDNGLTAKVTRTDGTDSFVIEENTYDAAGNLVKQVTNNRTTTTKFDYDSASRLVSTTVDPEGEQRKTSYVHSPDDHLLSQTRSKGTDVIDTRRWIYDPMGRVVAETVPLDDSGLVGRWALGETSGTTAADSAGNANATLSGGVTWSAERGGSLAFDGASGSAACTTGPVVDTTRSFSVTAWVKLSSLPTSNKYAVSQDGTRRSGFLLGYSAETNRWRMMMSTPNSDTASVVRESTTVPSVGTWTHLVGVYDQQAKKLRLYVNGVLESEGDKTSLWEGATGPLCMGRIIWGGNQGYWWPGSIDDVQVYDRVLSGSEVGTVYAGAGPGDGGAGVVRTTYDLDVDGTVRSVTDPNGATTYTSTDEAGRVTKVTAPAAMAETHGASPVLANAVTWRGYNTFGEQTDAEDANGNWTLTEYDAAGRPVSVRGSEYTPPGGSPIVPESTTDYDEMGQVESTSDPLGNTIRFEYDQLGRVTKATAPNNGETTYTYDLLGNVLSIQDPTGAVETTTYDYLGRVETSTQVVRQTSQAHTTTYDYDAAGRLWRVTSPDGVTQTTLYNDVGEPKSVTNDAGETTTFDYDDVGRPERTTLPDGTYQTATYDVAGRRIAVARHDSTGLAHTSEVSGYDRAGNRLTVTDGRGTTSTFAYDATGALVRHTQPISGSDAIVTSFGYDLAGNRTRFTDGRGNEFWTTYNTWNLPESTIEPATAAHPSLPDRTFTVSYDAAGRPSGQTLPGGVSTSYTYNSMGQVTLQAGAGAEATTQDRAFDYDLAGRMSSFSGVAGTNTVDYDDRGLVTSITGPSGDSSFTYTGDGAIASRTDAAGTTSYTYDHGRLATAAHDGSPLLSIEYDDMSRPEMLTYGSNGNRRHLSYDPIGRLDTDELRRPDATVIASIGYEWDGNSNLTRKTTDGFSGVADNHYDYDLANRLVGWDDGTTVTVYAYDKSGNRLQNGSGLFTYDERNRLVTAGADGYTYTPRGTLLSAGGVPTAADAFGQVVTQGHAGGSQIYGYDGLGRAVRPGFAYSGLGNHLAADASAQYVRDPGGAVLATDAGGLVNAWTDLHSDVVGQFTAGGAALSGSVTYDPLGKVLASAGMVGNLGYQQEWTDALTDRVNMLARWYNTATGQFDTRDSAANSPVPASVAANRYQYGDANPLTVTDPTGHWGINLGAVWNKATSAVKSAVSTTVSTVRRVASTAMSYASSAYNYVRSAVSNAYNYVRDKVSQAYNYVKEKVTQAVTWVKDKVTAAARWTYHAYQTGRDYVAAKAAAAIQAQKQFVQRVISEGKKQLANAKRAVQEKINQVKDAARAAADWIAEHKDTILEVAAIAAAIGAGLACTAITAGAGAVACMVGTAALINVAKDYAQGDIKDWGDLAQSAGTGALTGLGGGAAGIIGGRIASAVGGRLGASLFGRAGAGAISGAAADSVVGAGVSVGTQLINTGRVDGGQVLRDAAFSAATGGVFGAAGGAISNRPLLPRGCPTRSRHSFDPTTQVLMADGTTRPISDVNIGDKVTATDPSTGATGAQPVTMLHANRDTDLTDLTLVVTAAAAAGAGTAARATGEGDGERSTRGPTSVTLHTTNHHPFWDATTGAWVNAADLEPGHELLVHPDTITDQHPTAGPRVVKPGTGPVTVTVAKVHNYTGAAVMRDLTVANIHTYYVLAGESPILVHNCGDGSPEDLREHTLVDSANSNTNNHAGSVARSQYTGETAYGESGATTPGNVNPQLVPGLRSAEAMVGQPGTPDWDPGICAEFQACNNLLNHDPYTRLEDVEYHTVDRATGQPIPSCLWCQIILGGATER
jgi:RHS repeat-associated protein